ncbi:hypothetical protein [Streptosporangium sp. NPDC003464]
MPSASIEHHDPAGAGPALTDFIVRVDQDELAALAESPRGRADLTDFSHAVVWALILLRTLERQGTYAGEVDDDRAHLWGLIRALERTLLPRMHGVRDAAVRWHAKLGGSHGDLAGAMGVARSTASTRVQALVEREPSEGERWALGRSAAAPARHTVVLDLDDEHTHFVLTEALRDFAARQRQEADHEDAQAGESSEDGSGRRAWATAADTLLDRLDAAV